MFSHAKPQNSRIGGKKSQKQSAHFVLSHISQAANIHNDNSKTKRKIGIYHSFLITEQKTKYSSKTLQKKCPERNSLATVK